jgi:hypothetical protein
MLIYSASVALYLAYVGFAEGLIGVFLWPAVVLHVILAALLARDVTRMLRRRTAGASVGAFPLLKNKAQRPLRQSARGMATKLATASIRA